MTRAPTTAILAMLLGLAAAQAGAQAFSSVSTRTTEEPPAEPAAPASPDANPFLTGSAAAAAARGELPPATPSAPPTDVPTEDPTEASAEVPTVTPAATPADASSATPAEAPNPFLTGSAAAAAAASSNPFLTGSAARIATAPQGWATTSTPLAVVTPATDATSPAPGAPTSANPFLTGSAAAMVLPELSASAGTQPFGTRYDDAIATVPRGREPADHILVKKSERRLYLLRDGRVIAEYPIKLGLNPTGPKRFEGDFRTPEGSYQLVRRNSNSEYFLALEVSYPNARDLERARELGLPPGGLIMIHGQPNSPSKPATYYASNDWTNGCIALSNPDMVDVWLRTDLGTPIEIRP
ncbi:MAG: L,D-transpeptidase family protein [Steroidobacteraceae bacterium]